MNEQLKAAIRKAIAERCLEAMTVAAESFVANDSSCDGVIEDAAEKALRKNRAYVLEQVSESAGDLCDGIIDDGEIDMKDVLRDEFGTDRLIDEIASAAGSWMRCNAQVDEAIASAARHAVEAHADDIVRVAAESAEETFAQMFATQP